MWYMPIVERNIIPDSLIRWFIRRNLQSGARSRAALGPAGRQAAVQTLADQFRDRPIAIHTDDANRQHYEVPAAFFQIVLGPWLKYSGCYWPSGVTTLADAEAAMLRLTCERAGVQDGMAVLDLGCGWGSLSLWIATHYPNCPITAVSNSRTQKAHIEAQCAARGLSNVTVITADANHFQPTGQFDRILSIEMFEHMKNYQSLLARIATWLKPGGELFVHIFSLRDYAFEFDASDPTDWMAQTFFSGGTMPAHNLLSYFQDDLALVQDWHFNGRHYGKTLRAWLNRMDAHEAQIRPILADTYGLDQVTRWWVNWRLFFIACEETFNLNGGEDFRISHYRFAKRG
jgi:cyclopropane-fatty-acyl-phospholipid synthase